MKIPSALLLLMALAASPVAASVSVDTTGLAAWYPFSGNAGDSSGHGNHGTVYGATPCADRYGLNNRAYSFDGVDDYIGIPYALSMNPDSQMTVSAWVMADAWGGLDYSNYVLGNEQNSQKSGYMLRGGATSVTFQIGSAGNWRAVTTAVGVVTTGTWYHLAGTFDGYTLRIYVDGTERASSTYTGTITPSSGSMLIGTSPESYLRWFNGTIDDIMIFTRALSQGEIDTLAGFTSIAVPVLISPENGASLSELIFPTFVWHAVDSADHYRFQLASSASFSSGSLIEDFTLLDTTATPILAPQGSGPFWWRVTAHNGPYSRASETWTFGFWKPILISPPRDTVFSTWNTPSFIWHAEDSADYYRLWVAHDAEFTNIVINHALIDTQYTPAGPLADGHYYWKVKAYGAEYLEAFQSETRFFAVNVYGGLAGEPAVTAPERYELAPPCPNPAKSVVRIIWEQQMPGNARLEIYDVAGKRVKVLYDGWAGNGVHARKWDLRNKAGNRVPAGIYFCRLRAGEFEDIKRLTVVR